AGTGRRRQPFDRRWCEGDELILVVRRLQDEAPDGPVAQVAIGLEFTGVDDDRTQDRFTRRGRIDLDGAFHLVRGAGHIGGRAEQYLVDDEARLGLRRVDDEG